MDHLPVETGNHIPAFATVLFIIFSNFVAIFS